MLMTQEESERITPHKEMEERLRWFIGIHIGWHPMFFMTMDTRTDQQVVEDFMASLCWNDLDLILDIVLNPVYVPAVSDGLDAELMSVAELFTLWAKREPRVIEKLGRRLEIASDVEVKRRVVLLLGEIRQPEVVVWLRPLVNNAAHFSDGGVKDLIMALEGCEEEIPLLHAMLNGLPSDRTVAAAHIQSRLEERAADQANQTA